MEKSEMKKMRRFFPFNLLRNRSLRTVLAVFLLLSISTAFFLYLQYKGTWDRHFVEALLRIRSQRTIHAENRNGHKINVAAVICGSLDYLETMLKTVLLFSQDVTALHFILFSDSETMPNLQQFMQTSEESQKHGFVQFTYELHNTWFPEDPKFDWKGMYLNCTNQRLFFPSLLPHIDSLIYLDGDVILMGNLSTLWNEFNNMDNQQLIAMSPDTNINYPGRFKIPYVNKTKHGVNAGIALMNLTRLRAFDFETKIQETYIKYKKKIRLADQDLMNILFHFYPEKIYILSCRFNMYLRRCEKKYWCPDVKTWGIHIVHGAGGTFKAKQKPTPTTTPKPKKTTKKSKKKKPAPKQIPIFFPWMYNVTKNFDLASSPFTFMNQLKNEYKSKDIQCYGSSPDILVQNLKEYLINLEQIQIIQENQE